MGSWEDTIHCSVEKARGAAKWFHKCLAEATVYYMGESCVSFVSGLQGRGRRGRAGK